MVSRSGAIVHKLKVVEPYYTSLKERKKTFEVRKNDRDFQVGDLLILQQYDAETKEYSGKEIHCIITYVLDDEQYCKEGYCVLGLAFSNGNDSYEE